MKTWLGEGLVDALVGDTFATPENVNSNLDVSELVAAARDTPCRVYAAVHALVDSDRLGQAAPEMIRACAHNAWQQGVDGLYLAHWFGMWPYEAAVLPNAARAALSRHHVAQRQNLCRANGDAALSSAGDGAGPSRSLPVDLRVEPCGEGAA